MLTDLQSGLALFSLSLFTMPAHASHETNACIRETICCGLQIVSGCLSPILTEDNVMKSIVPILVTAVIGSLMFDRGSSCLACSVPVFRYALEKWQPDPYQVLIFHRGELSADHAELVRQLDSGDPQLPKLANLQVTRVSLDQTPPTELLELFEPYRQQAGDQPFLIVLTPARHGSPSIVTAEPLSQSAVERLLDSPVRKEIARRILHGDSVVWIFLDSSQPEQDDAAFLTLTAEIARLQKTLKLPELAEEDVRELGIESASVKLAFSAIRVARTDPQEKLLVDMLLRVEPDLLDDEFRDQRMAFPVFGRGRALHALVGEGISPELIGEACQFLTGACQCTVKAENPGVDLLMAVNWEGLVEPSIQKEVTLPPLAGLGGFAEPPASASAADNPVSSDGTNEPDSAAVARTAPPVQTPTEPAAAADEVSGGTEGTQTANLGAQTDADTTQHSSAGPAPVPQAVADSMVRNLKIIIAAIIGAVIVGSILLGRRSSENV